MLNSETLNDVSQARDAAQAVLDGGVWSVDRAGETFAVQVRNKRGIGG